MGKLFGEAIGGTVDRLVRWLVIPVTGAIPFLVSSGILLAAFACAWLAFGAAVVANPAALDSTWRSIGQLPLPIQALAWLLALPLMAGLWVWEAGWPLVVRLVVVAALAGWNLLVFIPRRGDREADAGASAR